MKKHPIQPKPSSFSNADFHFDRRRFLQMLSGTALFSLLNPRALQAGEAEDAPGPNSQSEMFWVRDIPNQPFGNNNHHAGIDTLIGMLGAGGLKFYRSPNRSRVSGRWGLIAKHDVVLIKVNAQWKYRGCTNSDVIRGLIQRILNHPDGFAGEVVIIENGQGRGSLNCDTSELYDNGAVRANANDRSHSFVYLADTVFAGSPVSALLLDPFRQRFIDADDHWTDGYRKLRYVSYPCFTTPYGNRVELREGVWTGSDYRQNLKLINVPVLKHHAYEESGMTASLKHVYGLLSMADGYSGFRHFSGLGRTCGKMFADVRAPALNIIDAIWVSFASQRGHPADTTRRMNQLLAGQDPVALDYWAAKYILHPIDGNNAHHPSSPAIAKWLDDAATVINNKGGLYRPQQGIFVDRVTLDENHMQTHADSPGAATPI
ncbi:MAG: DUF362 domain-containing protein [Kiritimatiellia bacterium]